MTQAKMKKPTVRGRKSPEVRRYSAPALEKGLDILEFLAEHQDGCGLAEVALGIGRTKGEIFRMLAVLEARRYVERDREAERYRVTDKLFRLGLRQPRYRALVQVSAPFMESFSEATRYPCHLAIPTGSQIAVIARAEGKDLVGVSVRVGYRQPLTDTGSGMCLLAFMPEYGRKRALDALRAEKRKVAASKLEADLKQIRKDGGLIEQSRIMEGVWDISCPIMVAGEAIAALTVPYVRLKTNAISRETLARRLSETAGRISVALRDAS